MSLGDLLERIGHPRQGAMQCGRCGARFGPSAAGQGRLGDAVCPQCSSANISYAASRLERARSFLVDYNTY